MMIDVRRWITDGEIWTPTRIALYLVGSVLFSIGVKMFIDAGLGVDPLHAMVIGIVGVIDHAYVRIGFVASAVTILFLLVWCLWNRKLPPLMTFVTMALVGYLVDLWNLIGLESVTSAYLAPVPLMLMGLLIDAYASALIIMSGIGIRVMDLVALTFVKRLGWSFLWAKLLFEVGFVAVAWMLAGPVGIGTLGFVLIVGTLIAPMMWASGKFLGLPNYGLAQKANEPVLVRT